MGAALLVLVAFLMSGVLCSEDWQLSDDEGEKIELQLPQRFVVEHTARVRIATATPQKQAALLIPLSQLQPFK